MNNKLVEHDRRLSKLEFEMGGVRKLARKTSEDVADIKITLDAHTATLDSHTAKLDSHDAKLDVHKRLLEALRQNQIDHGKELRDFRSEMRDFKAEVREGFSKTAVGMAQMIAILTIGIDQSEKPHD